MTTVKWVLQVLGYCQRSAWDTPGRLQLTAIGLLGSVPPVEKVQSSEDLCGLSGVTRVLHVGGNGRHFHVSGDCPQSPPSPPEQCPRRCWSWRSTRFFPAESWRGKTVHFAGSLCREGAQILQATAQTVLAERQRRKPRTLPTPAPGFSNAAQQFCLSIGREFSPPLLGQTRGQGCCLSPPHHGLANVGKPWGKVATPPTS